jgi:uncharacterized protein YbaP (TraB family)
MNTNHNGPLATPAHLGKLSRRQLMLTGMAATVGSLATHNAWSAALPATPWPLWSVEGHGGKAYVFGGTPPRARPWRDHRIEQVLTTCSTLWTETNSIRRGNISELVQRLGMDPDTPLTQRISSAEAQRLVKAAQVAHVRPEELAPFRPWFAGFTVENAYHARIGHPHSSAAEPTLIAMAKKAGLEVQSEFAAQDDVLVYMGGLTGEADQQFLSYSMDQVLAGPAANERIYADWARGDSARADAVVLGLKANYPALYASLVLGRNRDWVPRFDAMLRADKPALAVLGLYHMAGPDSVLVQLQAQGWTVRAV